MFDSLTNKLNNAFKNITGKAKLSEKNMDDMLKEVRMSLLEADVNYGVVKEFVDNIKIKWQGLEVSKSLDPSQMVLKIVKEELVALLGDSESPLHYQKDGITTIMMVGLQGTGKTTAAAKIANLLKNKQQRKVLLAACDVIRPAAIEQLQVLGKQIEVEVYTEGVEVSALTNAKNAIVFAKEHDYDTVIFDSAGRLHLDDELMQELSDLKELLHPSDILLAVDAMTGQDIVNVAQAFHERLHVSGLVLTKLDGDARGGGILSVRAITNVPVKFVGQGEKMEDLDVFYPERMADRILGMGDVLTLIEQAEAKMDKDLAEQSVKRMMSGQFNLNDMMVQLQQISKMGSLGKIMKMLPGMGNMASSMDEAKSEGQLKTTKAMLSSMTNEEREHPEIIKAARKKRIAQGSGCQVSDLNRLLSQFEKTKKMMFSMMKMQQNGGMPNDQIPKGIPMPQSSGKKKFVSKLKKRR
ncbi:MAG: signal recognition particle protein [Breznakia sp.]